MRLTKANYYSLKADAEFMSVSQYKLWLDCPARAMATLKGEYKQPETKSLLVGSFVDAYFDDELESFKEEHPDIFNSRTGELKADYKQAEEIIKRCKSDKVFMEYMSGKKQVIKTAKLFGIPWKIRMDVYRPKERIVDLKVVRSFERIMGISFIQHWLYDTQLAVYSKIESLATGGDQLETYIAAATKEDVTDLEIIHIPHWRHQECLADVEKNIPKILAYKSGELEAHGCGVCPYCRSVKKLTAPKDFELVGFSNKDIALMEGKIF